MQTLSARFYAALLSRGRWHQRCRRRPFPRAHPGRRGRGGSGRVPRSTTTYLRVFCCCARELLFSWVDILLRNSTHQVSRIQSTRLCRCSFLSVLKLCQTPYVLLGLGDDDFNNKKLVLFHLPSVYVYLLFTYFCTYLFHVYLRLTYVLLYCETMVI